MRSQQADAGTAVLRGVIGSLAWELCDLISLFPFQLPFQCFCFFTSELDVPPPLASRDDAVSVKVTHPPYRLRVSMPEGQALPREDTEQGGQQGGLASSSMRRE